MPKRLIIICEGQTEQEFCRSVLYPFFLQKDIFIETPLIKKSNGGIVAWGHIKKQVEKHLKEDTEPFVTTFIDYYGIQAKHDFPNWNGCLNIADKNRRVDMLEDAMKSDISSDINYRFIPYIQLHEFEGLLFNNISVFEQLVPANEFTDKDELENIINNNPNPELINDGQTTAPSKRLKRLITGYNKIVYGSIIAEAIGLTNIRAKSTRFNTWMSSLEGIHISK